MNGSMVKNHISSETGFGFLQHGATSFLLWFQACQIRLLDLVSEIQTPEREDGIDSDISPVQVSTSVGDRSGQLDETQAKKQNIYDKMATEHCARLQAHSHLH